MSAPAVARNYAEVLFELGERSGRTETYGELIHAVAGAVASSELIEATLVSPRVPKAAKAALVGRALGNLPPEFVRFLQALIQRNRHHALGGIAQAYEALLDDKLSRVRAHLTLVRSPDPALAESIRQALGAALGKEVITTWHAEPEILGGTVVKVGERVFDGSVRRRMARLRRQLL